MFHPSLLALVLTLAGGLPLVVQSIGDTWFSLVRFNPAGGQLLSKTADNTLYLWTRDGRILRIIPPEAAGGVQNFEYDPTGGTFVTTHREGGLRIHAQDGEVLTSARAGKNPYPLVFDPAGHRLFVAGEGAGGPKQRLQVFDSRDGRLLLDSAAADAGPGLRALPRIHGLAYHRGRRLLYGSADCAIWSWDGDPAHARRVRSLPCVAPEFSRALLLGEAADRLYTVPSPQEFVWFDLDLADGGRVSVAPHSLRGFDVDPTGWQLWGWTEANHLLQVDARARKIVRDLDQGKDLWSFALTAEGAVAACTYQDPALRILAADGQVRERFEGRAVVGIDVVFAPDGNRLAVSRKGGVSVWSLDGRLVHRLEDGVSPTVGLHYTADGRLLTSIRQHEGVRRWDAAGRLVHRWEAPRELVGGAVTDDGAWIAVGVKDGRRLAYTPATGETREVVPKSWPAEQNLSNDFGSFRFIPGTTILVTGHRKALRQRPLLESGPVIEHANGYAVQGPDFAIRDDGQLFVSPDRTTGHRLDSQSVTLTDRRGKEIRKLEVRRDRHSLTSIAICTPQQYFAVASEANVVQLFRFDGTPRGELTGATGQIRSIAMTRDCRYLAGVATEGRVIVWRPDAPETFLSLFESRDGDWLAILPDGTFDASPKGGNLVGVRQGLEVLGIDQFAVRHNRPDRLLERMGSGTPELIDHFRSQYQRRLRKLQLTEAEVEAEPRAPDATITAHSQQGRTMTLKLACHDDRLPLRRYHVFVNDVPLFGAAGKPLTGQRWTGSESFELSAGENRLEFSCTNQAEIDSRRALLLARHAAPALRDLYYLGLGVSRYRHPGLELQYAAKDARDLEAALRGLPGFGKIITRVYTDEQVTPANLRKARELTARARPDDVFVLFVAGHGMHARDREATYYYLTQGSDPARLAQTALDFSTLEELLQGIPPRQKLFLLDTCESGEAEETPAAPPAAGAVALRSRAARGLKLTGQTTPAVRSQYAARDRYIYNDLVRRSGAIVFSSSRGDEFSYESDQWENGLFTEQVLVALTTDAADRDRDGAVSSDELRAHVSREVAAASQELQHPTVDRDNLSLRLQFPWR